MTGENRQQNLENISNLIAEKKREDLGLEIGHLICENAKKINEGNNGVIFEVRTDLMETGLKKFLAEKGIEISENQVLKMLKIYRPGYGKREFEIQQAAYQALNASEDVAKIPRPIFFIDLQLDKATLDFLNNSGLHFPEGRAELLLMDLVPGADLATLFYRQALKEAQPENYPDLDSVSVLSFNTLQTELIETLGFKKPGGRGSTESEKAFEARKVDNENAEKLFDFLRKKGFLLPPSVLVKLEKTLRSLHNRGIFHRDLHERNIMISGDLNDEETLEVYLLDFGSAKIVKTGQESGVYEEAEMVYSDDNSILNRLRPLTTSIQEQRDADLDSRLKTFKKVIAKKRTDPWILANVKFFKDQRADINSLSEILTGFQTKPTEDFFVLLEILRSDGLLSKEDLLIFLNRQKISRGLSRGGVSPSLFNKLQEYRNLLSSE